MTDQQWVEIPDVATQLRIPDRTLRRYIERHGRFIENKRVGRRHLVAERAVPILTRIRDLYLANKTAEQVDADLVAAQLPVTIDVPGQASPVTMAQLISAMTTELTSLRSEVATLRAALHTRDTELEGRLEDLVQAAVTTLTSTLTEHRDGQAAYLQGQVVCLQETISASNQPAVAEVAALRGEVEGLRAAVDQRQERAEERDRLLMEAVQAIRQRSEIRQRRAPAWWPFGKATREDNT